MAQWTSTQVHDTVAAIIAQRSYDGQRQSLLGRLFHFLLEKFNDLLRWARGSIDARLVITVAVALLVVIIAARVIIERRAAVRRLRLSTKSRGAERSRDRWTESRALADAGRFEEASHAVYAAIIEAVTAAGIVRYHRSKTAGDYARELSRAGSSLASDFRAFGREFDRLAFGRVSVSRDDYDRLERLAERVFTAAHRQTAA